MSSTITETGSRHSTHRHAITEHLLTALEDVVHRYRTLALHAEHAELHAEVITAEVAHQLEVARTSLRRYPPLS
jgi:hypothetical protein